MKHYRTLSIVPDFREPPKGGVVVERSDTALNGANTFSRWGSYNWRINTLDFVLRGPSEVRAMRQFLQRVRGSWKPFYVPSWMRDFSGIGTVAAGSRVATIDRNLSSLLEAGDYPDTWGRTVYFFAGGTLHVARVISSTANGSNWDLLLDMPFPVGMDLTRALAGFAWFARIGSTELEFEHITPDRAGITLGIRETRNAITGIPSGSYELSDAGIYESEPFELLLEDTGFPGRSDMRTAIARGPMVYSESQIFNFVNEWSATINAAGTVTLTDGSETRTSAIYDGGATVEHISLAFDVLGDEAIAWVKDFSTIRLRWHASGVPQALEFTGTTPLLFQNWTINGTIAGGDADIVCYYVKADDSKLFARYQRDSFATEYTAALLPVMPLALIENLYTGETHEISAISTRHTRLTIRSGTYPIPFPPVTDELAAEASFVGDVEELLVVIPTVSEFVEAETSFDGEFRLIAVPFVAPLENVNAGTSIDQGAYIYLGVDPVPTPTLSSDEITSGTEFDGGYTLTAVEADGSDAAGGSTEFSGTYENVL